MFSAGLRAELQIEITAGVDKAVPIAVVPFGWSGTGAQPPQDELDRNARPLDDRLAHHHPGIRYDTIHQARCHSATLHGPRHNHHSRPAGHESKACRSPRSRSGRGQEDRNHSISGGTPRVFGRFQTHETNQPGDRSVLKFIGGTIGVIFLIGLLAVIGLFALIF